MRVINLSSPNGKEGPQELEEKMYSIWISRSEKDQDLQAEEVLAAQLSKLLDNRYTLVRGAELPGMEIKIPLILVGPTGVRVFNASGLTGIYRVRQDAWEAVSEDGQKYTPTRPNIVARTLLMTQLLDDYLVKMGYEVISGEPILYFCQPGIDVETDKPALRIVITDKLENYIKEVVESPVTLDDDQVNNVLDALLKTNPDRDGILRHKPTSVKKPKLLGVGKIQLHFWQWIILGIMIIVQILLIITFVILVWITSQ
jgi:hypothetical protein